MPTSYANYGYWQAVVETRAESGDAEKQFHGAELISAETRPDISSDTAESFARAHFATFLRSIRPLPPMAQVGLVTHLVLGWSQSRLVPVMGCRAQTRVSSVLRESLAYVGHIVAGTPVPHALDMAVMHAVERKRERVHIYRSDPPCVGLFRIRVEDADFDADALFPGEAQSHDVGTVE